MKVESGVSALSPTQTGELFFLRSRVRELEREKAELSAENQRLKTMLVHGESRSSLVSESSLLTATQFIFVTLCFPEIPGLLSTMWQTLGQANGHHSIPASAGRGENYAPYLHQQHSANQDAELRPQVNSQQLQEDLSGDIFESWGPLGSEDEEMPGGADLGLGSHMGEEAPLCSQTNMEELRRSCSESQCTAGNMNGHVSRPHTGNEVILKA